MTAAVPAAEGSAAALKPSPAVEASAAETLKTPTAAEAVGSWSAAALKPSPAETMKPPAAAESVGNWRAAALEAGRRRSAAKAVKAAAALGAMERRAASVQTRVGRNAAVHAGA